VKEIIEQSIEVKATAGEVWHALTDKDELENWWSEDVTLEGRVGGKFQEHWEDDEGKAQLASGKVIEVKDKKFISFTWREKDWPQAAQTLCSFAIETLGAKCKLTMKHEGWEALPESLRKSLLKEFKIGWTYHLKELKAYLDE